MSPDTPYSVCDGEALSARVFGQNVVEQRSQAEGTLLDGGGGEPLGKPIA